MMKVSNFPVEKRLYLYNKWEKELLDKSLRGDSFEWFGNFIYIDPYHLSDPTYIIPEWNSPVPKPLRELYDKIGTRCKYGRKEYIFAGILATYEDFYYRLLADSGEEELLTVVATLEFI